MVEAVLAREKDGKSGWRIRRYTRPLPSPADQQKFDGQVFAVDVELLDGGPLAVVASYAMSCRQAAKDATLSIDHQHDDGCQFAYLEGLGPVRAWQFMGLNDAVLAALRWDADEDAEPFGWTRALDGTGRIRPKGDPLLEVV